MPRSCLKPNANLNLSPTMSPLARTLFTIAQPACPVDDGLDSLARVDAALRGIVTGKSSLVRRPLLTMSRDAIASLIRSFRAKGHTVKAVGQYPRPGYRYLCSGFEYR